MTTVKAATSTSEAGAKTQRQAAAKASTPGLPPRQPAAASAGMPATPAARVAPTAAAAIQAAGQGGAEWQRKAVACAAWPATPGSRAAAFADITAARQAAADWARHVDSLRQCRGRARGVSEKAAADYTKEAERLLRDASGPDAVWVRAADTTKVATWNKRASALTWYATRRLGEMLSRQEKLQKRGASEASSNEHQVWLATVSQVAKYGALIAARPTERPLAKVTPRASKQNPGNVPEDWREQLAARLPRWREIYLAQALTGCRPEEIGHGITLHIMQRKLIATIHGAKLGDDKGQKERSLEWSVAGAPRLVQMVVEEVNRKGHGGVMFVSFQGRDHTRPTATYSRAIANAAKRAWPNNRKSITAYSLRHAFAADLKSSDIEREDCSAAMGHQVDRTISGYGRARTPRAGSVAPQKISATTAVRQKAKTPAALQQLAQRAKKAAGGASKMA